MSGEQQRRSVGDRVVISVNRKEVAGVISVVGRVGYVVTVESASASTFFRHPQDVFDVYNDGREP